MPQTEACLFSPFSPSLVRQKHHCVLLLQFFLKELLAAHQAILYEAPMLVVISPERRHFPYDWGQESGHINKALEHAKLLTTTFENLEYNTRQIASILTDLVVHFSEKESLNARNKLHVKKKLHQIYTHAEPLISHYKNNEDLTFFLLKNRGSINALMGHSYLHTFLLHLHNAELGDLEKRLCDYYHERGFFSLIPPIKKMFSELN